MKIRNLPFGYCIKNGKTCVEENAADTVRMIFRRYIQGASYQKLANVLEQDNIPYIAGKRWNKNIIARILKDIRYTGDEEYPPIIAQDMFRGAAESNEWSCASPERVKFIKNMRALVRCPLCGGTMFRNIRANWRCPDCMDTSVKVTDEALERSAAELLKQLSRTTSSIEIPDASSKMGTVQGLEDELLQALDQAEFDEEAAKGRAVALASARFDALGSEDYETMRIQYILTRAEQNGGLDTELLRQITSAILIHPNGAVSLKLKNGQIIEKE